jgi:CBS domain-containing protein
MSKADAFTQAGKTAVLQNIQGTLQFLQRFPPFNQMEHAHLAFLVEQCQLRFYGQGESIIKPADGPVEHFYIVKQGRVVGERQHITRPGTETTFEITTGECFPLAALLGERATRTEHLAGEDTFCLQLNKPRSSNCLPCPAASAISPCAGSAACSIRSTSKSSRKPWKPSAPSIR